MAAETILIGDNGWLMEIIRAKVRLLGSCTSTLLFIICKVSRSCNCVYLSLQLGSQFLDLPVEICGPDFIGRLRSQADCLQLLFLNLLERIPCQVGLGRGRRGGQSRSPKLGWLQGGSTVET